MLNHKRVNLRFVAATASMRLRPVIAVFLNPCQATEPYSSFMAVSTEPNVQLSFQNWVKAKKHHHVSRRPIFLLRSGEDQKKRSSRLPTSNFPPKLSGQQPPVYATESVRILKDFHQTPETAPSNTTVRSNPGQGILSNSFPTAA